MSLVSEIVSGNIQEVKRHLEHLPEPNELPIAFDFHQLTFRLSPIALATLTDRVEIAQLFELPKDEPSKQDLLMVAFCSDSRGPVIRRLRESGVSKEVMISVFRSMQKPEYQVYRLAMNLFLKQHGCQQKEPADPKQLLEIACQVGDMNYVQEHCSSDLESLHMLAGIAARHGHRDILDFILTTYNLDPYTEDADGFSLSAAAAENGHVEILVYLSNKEVEINRPLGGENQGWTISTLAAHNGHLPVLEYLHEHGLADLHVGNPSGDQEGLTPAYLAALHNHPHILRYLHGIGVDLSQPLTSGQFKGETPAFIAVLEECIEVLECLSELKIDLLGSYTFPLPGLIIPEFIDSWTLPTLAAMNGSVRLLKFFKETCGFDLSESCVMLLDGEFSPVSIAAQFGHLEALSYLVDLYEIDIMKPQAYGCLGFTIAGIAIRSDCPNVLEFCRSRGLNLNESFQLDGYDISMTPATTATWYDAIQVIHYLHEHQITLDPTIIDEAVAHGSLKILQFFDLDKKSPQELSRLARIAAGSEKTHILEYLKATYEVDLLEDNPVIEHLVSIDPEILTLSFFDEESDRLVQYGDLAKEHGQVALLKKLVSQHFFDDQPEYVNEAAKKGNLDFLEVIWKLDKDLISTKAVLQAAEFGHVKVLQLARSIYIFSLKLPQVVVVASQHRQLNVLKYVKTIHVESDVWKQPIHQGFFSIGGVLSPSLAFYLAFLLSEEIVDKAFMASLSIRGMNLANLAAFEENIDVLRFLHQEKIVDVSSPIEDVSLPHFAAAQNKIELLKFLNEECSVDFDEKLTFGQHAGKTPLELAVERGHKEAITYLNRLNLRA